MVMMVMKAGTDLCPLVIFESSMHLLQGQLSTKQKK